jgi:hypothetical protein
MGRRTVVKPAPEKSETLCEKIIKKQKGLGM